MIIELHDIESFVREVLRSFTKQRHLRNHSEIFSGTTLIGAGKKIYVL